MRRKTTRSFYIVLAAISLVSAAIFIVGKNSQAASIPVGHLVSPANNSSIQASASGTARIQFITYATDAEWHQVKTQVMYRAVGSSQWYSFGNTNLAETPDGNRNALANGLISNWINAYGWNCVMGWGSTPPASCDVVWSNGAVSGRPAFPGYNTYTPSVQFGPGTYEWTVRSTDNYNYGAWPARWRFTVTPPHQPPPPPTPTPTPTPAPAPDGGTDYTSDGGGTYYDYGAAGEGSSSAPDVVSPIEDTQPPTVPINLKAEYSADESSINLSWEPSTDDTSVQGYEIERTEKSLGTWGKIDTAESESYSDFNFEPQKSYQYRIRAFDQKNNKSDYSNWAEATAGGFTPNVTVKEGGIVQDDEQKVLAEFNPSNVSEDLFVIIEKTNDRNFKIEDNSQLVGDVYDIKAKNNRGEEVTRFNSQIKLTIKYSKADSKGANTNTIRMAYANEEKSEYLYTKRDIERSEVTTLVDHFSSFYLVAEKSSPWLTFLRIILWILVIIAIGFAGYFGWVYYQKKQYQKAHKDDYIYKH